jgi:hypothetical protein
VAQRTELNKLKNQLDSDLKSTASQLESEVERRGILEGNVRGERERERHNFVR